MKKKIDILTGDFVHDWYTTLSSGDKCGCCHLPFACDDKYKYSVCMGWTDYDKTKSIIAWKIGRQTHDNIMQCDLDIDFEMPYDAETGEVDDTWATVSGNENWEALAKEMRDTARRVWKDHKGRGGMMYDHYNR